jgi:cytochrome P450
MSRPLNTSERGTFAASQRLFDRQTRGREVKPIRRQHAAHASAPVRYGDLAARIMADPRAYTDGAEVDSAFALLRDHAPVVWIDHPPYRPFWAITKHADINAIERDHTRWINAPRASLRPAQLEDSLRTTLAAGVPARTLVDMDGTHHRAVRAIGAQWFRPKAMRSLKAQIDALARKYVDQMVHIGPECDFVTEVATGYAGDAIFSLLGLPQDDYPKLVQWTQQAFGHDDNDLQRGGSPQNFLDILADFFQYFQAVTNLRRAQPTDDLGSAIANARIDGEYLTDTDRLNLYATLAGAGHDTTKAAIAGGLLALIEHPDELDRLTADLNLMPTAVEEMIRWTTPVKEFMRTATEDTVIRGTPIAAGQSVYLAYASGNRDGDVFDQPFRFDVGRNPNGHLGFGAGVHFCLGAALARMEMASFFTELLPRLRSIELAGEPKLIATTLVGGLKRLPIRYEIS